MIVLPSNSCGSTLQSLHIELLYSSLQKTSADGLNWQRQVSCMWQKGKTSYQKWAAGPSLWWQTVPCPRCSHWKGTVAKGSPTSRRHLQCRGVSRVKTVTSLMSAAGCRTGTPVLCHAHNGTPEHITGTETNLLRVQQTSTSINATSKPFANTNFTGKSFLRGGGTYRTLTVAGITPQHFRWQTNEQTKRQTDGHHHWKLKLLLN